MSATFEFNGSLFGEADTILFGPAGGPDESGTRVLWEREDTVVWTNIGPVPVPSATWEQICGLVKSWNLVPYDACRAGEVAS